MDILWIGPNYRYRYNSIHESLPDAMRQNAQVNLLRWGHGMDGGESYEHWGLHADVRRAVSDYGPFDLIVVQHPRHCGNYVGLRDLSIPKVAILTDYFPRNYSAKNTFLSVNKIDLALLPETYMVRVAEGFQEAGKLPATMRFAWLPFWADTDRFKPMGLSKVYDALALFSAGNNPMRKQVVETLQSSGLNVFARLVYGHADKVVGENYVTLINLSRVAVAVCGKHKLVNFKHFEYSACGVPWISDQAEDLEALGFVGGRHYASYFSPEETIMWVKAIIDSEHGFGDELASSARSLVFSRHTAQHRAQDLLDIIAQKL